MKGRSGEVVVGIATSSAGEHILFRSVQQDEDLDPPWSLEWTESNVRFWLISDGRVEGSETIRPTFTQWVRGGYFSKVPTKVPTG